MNIEKQQQVQETKSVEQIVDSLTLFDDDLMSMVFDSASASVAFLYAIPYGISVAVCIVVTMVLRKRESDYWKQ